MVSAVIHVPRYWYLLCEKEIHEWKIEVISLLLLESQSFLIENSNSVHIQDEAEFGLYVVYVILSGYMSSIKSLDRELIHEGTCNGRWNLRIEMASLHDSLIPCTLSASYGYKNRSVKRGAQLKKNTDWNADCLVQQDRKTQHIGCR